MPPFNKYQPIMLTGNTIGFSERDGLEKDVKVGARLASLDFTGALSWFF